MVDGQLTLRYGQLESPNYGQVSPLPVPDYVLSVRRNSYKVDNHKVDNRKLDNHKLIDHTHHMVFPLCYVHMSMMPGVDTPHCLIVSSLDTLLNFIKYITLDIYAQVHV